jgi:hypothetical protein
MNSKTTLRICTDKIKKSGRAPFDMMVYGIWFGSCGKGLPPMPVWFTKLFVTFSRLFNIGMFRVFTVCSIVATA